MLEKLMLYAQKLVYLLLESATNFIFITVARVPGSVQVTDILDREFRVCWDFNASILKISFSVSSPACYPGIDHPAVYWPLASSCRKWSIDCTELCYHKRIANFSVFTERKPSELGRICPLKITFDWEKRLLVCHFSVRLSSAVICNSLSHTSFIILLKIWNCIYWYFPQSYQ